MSSPSAIAAVTRTLTGLLEGALQLHDPAFRVTNLPLDKSNAETQTANRLNLFLIQPFHNAALRNTNHNYAAVYGESAQPPLAINLTYMITTYGEATPETKDQVILGVAMQFLNDHPVLLADDIKNAFPGTGLENQFERVRITPREVSLEEMSRMWSTFMTQYRTSAAYDVSVVLVDNSVPVPAASPVLRRGVDDTGVFVEPGFPPLLTAALGPELLRRGAQVTRQPAVRLGQVLTIEGERLPTEGGVAQIRSLAWRDRWVETDAVPGQRPGTLEVTLADPPATSRLPGPALAWAPGVFSATVVKRVAGRPDVVSSSVTFGLAPTVQVSPGNAAPGNVTLTVKCAPPPRDGQTVRLLLSRRAPIAPTGPIALPAPGQPATITFDAKALVAGEYVVRLMVDGVESVPYRVTQLPNGTPSLEPAPGEVVVIA
jgi:Pvc16 N-terminal domain